LLLRLFYRCYEFLLLQRRMIMRGVLLQAAATALVFFFFYFLGLLINLGYQLLNKNLNKTHVSFYSEKKKKNSS
jgi:hypothetical protein